MGRRTALGSHFRRWWPLYGFLLVVVVVIIFSMRFLGCFSINEKPEIAPIVAGNSDYVDVMYPTNQADLLKADKLVKDKDGRIIGITFEALRELLQSDLAQKIKDDVALQDLLRGPQGDPGSSYQVAGSSKRGPKGEKGSKGDRGEKGVGVQGPPGPAGKVDSVEVARLAKEYLESSAGQNMIASFVAKSIKTTTKQSSQKIRVPQTITIDVERTDVDKD